MRPALDPARFAANRARALDLLQPGDAALIFGGSTLHRNADSEHRYRPHSDVHFLSGWPDPDVAVLLRKGSDKPFVLFVQPRDPEREVWDGIRPGPEGAVSTFGADEAFPIEELSKRLPDLLLGVTRLHYRFGEDAARDRQLRTAMNAARNKARREGFQDTPDTIIDPERFLHEARLVKSEAEIALLQRAAEITARAHLAAMAMTRAGVHEYELEAVINHTFRSQGGDGPGYTSIIGGGANATILHYHANNDVLRDGDLVCVDAGCEYGFYTADVTRTWPVNGRFSPAQAEIYELVLAVQKDCVAASVVGVTWKELSDRAIRALTVGMVQLGLLTGEVDALIAEKTYKKYYMHGLGHWLGMDVHDVGAYVGGGQSRALAPGNVITIEPGIYVPVGDEGAPERFRGIGVRIEDDVLITEGGPVVLTAAIPKELAELEAAVLSSGEAAA